MSQTEGAQTMDMFNRRTLAAAVAVVATTVVSLGACAPPTIDRPLPEITAPSSPTTAIEQTAESSPTVDTTTSPDAPVFDIDNATEADWPAYTDGYEFSEQPQGPAEQWIFDNHPELWEQGIRAVTHKTRTMHPERGMGSIPGALVQYIGGERAEGTEDIPLRFRGQADDINKFPTDVFPGVMEVLKNPSQWPEGSIGEGGYVVSIREHYYDHRGEVVNTSVDIRTHEGSTEVGGGGQRNFDTWEEAWDFLQKEGFKPNSTGARTLYPGEIAYITVVQENAHSQDRVLLNPETGEWDLVRSFKHPN